MFVLIIYKQMNKAIFLLLIITTMSNSNILFGQSDQLITTLSVSHLVQYPKGYSPTEKDKKYPLIIALHGHGSNEKDLIGLAQHLPNNYLWISGRGPHTFGQNSYDWYEVTQMGTPDPDRIATALKTLDLFIEELIKNYPVDPTQIYLLGFSQGSMISMSYLLAYPNRIAGVIAQSGYIPPNIGVEIDKDGVTGKPIIITHGLQDPNMPISWGQKNRDTFRKLGANVEYHEFLMGHSISNESLQAIKDWLEKL
ncbi:MAG: hypothetical protein CL840_02470 [Crocinitomicaceae bacterium]|nr:hypothetical protein [Crocinitomicaceae bacterium]